MAVRRTPRVTGSGGALRWKRFRLYQRAGAEWVLCFRAGAIVVAAAEPQAYRRHEPLLRQGEAQGPPSQPYRLHWDGESAAPGGAVCGRGVTRAETGGKRWGTQSGAWRCQLGCAEPGLPLHHGQLPLLAERA